MRLIILVILNLCFIQLKAQIIQGGIAIGKSIYWGDLNAPEFSANINNNGGLAFQGFVRYSYPSKTAFKVGLLLGKLQGNDQNSSATWQKERNLNFHSRIFELSVLGEYYIFGFDPTSMEKPFSPYITGGLALVHFDPMTDYRGATYSLQALGTEGQGNPGYASKYNKLAVSIPFGGGVAIKLNSTVNLSVDVIARRTFTDYLDDLSGNYVNYDELKNLNGELAATLADRTNEYLGINEPKQRTTGTQRGGKIVADWYFTAMVGFSFFLSDPDTAMRKKSNYKSSCPKF
jgi:Domain of unknown function (DUF6089)